MEWNFIRLVCRHVPGVTAFFTLHFSPGAVQN
jgi:hypothetical protein